MTRQIKAGSTDVSVVIRIVDSTDGTPETGVVFNTSGLDLEYRREGAASVDITEATLAALTTAHSDGGFLHIGNGYYRLDLPDAAVAAGATGVLIHGTCTGMVVIGEYIELVAYDPYDAVRMGLTALPNAAAEAAGGLFTRGTGAGQINQQANGQIDGNVARWLNTAPAALSTSGYLQVMLMRWLTDNAGGTPTALNTGQVITDIGEIQNTDPTAFLEAVLVPYFAAMVRKTAGLATDIPAIFDNLNVDYGSGAGTYNNTTDSLEALRDNYTAPLDAAGTRAAVGLSSANLDTQLAAVQADTDNIQTRIPAALVGGRMDSNIGAVSGDSAAADLLEMWLDGMVTGTAQGGDVDYITLAAGESAVDDLYKGYRVRIMSGTGAGQTAIGTVYNGTSKQLNILPIWSVTPDNTSVYLLVPYGVVNGNVVAINENESAPQWLEGMVTSYFASGMIEADVFNMRPGALATFFTEDSGQTYAGAVAGSVVKEIADNAGGGGGSDWTATEKEHIRYRLQIDGTQTAPTVDAPVQLPVDAQKWAGDTPNPLIGGRVDAILGSFLIDESRVDAACTEAGQTQSFTTNLTETEDDYYAGWVFMFTDVGPNRAVPRVVRLYNGTTKEITLVTPLPANTTNGHAFSLIALTAGAELTDGSMTLNKSYTASAVLDSEQAGFLTPGTIGESINEAATNTGLSAQEVRDAMKLAPSVGAPAAGSIDTLITTIDDLIDTEVNAIKAKTDLLDFTNGMLGADVQQWAGENVPTPVIAGVPLIDLRYVNGGATNGNNATLSLKQLNVINNTGTALVARSTGGNGDGIEATGHGTGKDINATTTDSLQVVSSGDLTAQQVRDAMKLAPSAGAAAGDSIDDMIATVETNTQNILDDTGTDIPALIAALNDLSSAEVGDAVLDEVVEGTLTLRQILRLSLAALANKATGGGTTTITFRDLADTKARITATVDANGNRTAVTLDGS